ncbi:hypothetical protein QFC19_008738 [Naganishia cerealis]|uniref:Uncharacterized protein n=1 Tax=Naganishia cerealis TaxID=610337 RepID=A0ACC2UZ00_9TREE|nr:hypothetical protein QFC19_008738 [Naganishia cerealis]
MPARVPGLTPITGPFLRACTALPPGTLVKAARLGMLDAMNALTVLDPRMDTGAVRPESTARPVPWAEGDAAEADIAPHEVCALIDRLTENEMQFNHGWPLVPTVFTAHLLRLLPSLRTLHLPPLMRTVVMPYIEAYNLALAYVWSELVTRAALPEGEDWTGDTAGMWNEGEEWALLGQAEEGCVGEDVGRRLLEAQGVVQRLEIGYDSEGLCRAQSLECSETRAAQAPIRKGPEVGRGSLESEGRSETRVPVRVMRSIRCAGVCDVPDRAPLRARTGSRVGGPSSPPPPSSSTSLALLREHEPSTRINACFDAHSARLFRQSMPVPRIPPLRLQETAGLMGRIVDGLTLVAELREEDRWAEREDAVWVFATCATTVGEGGEWAPVVRSCLSWSIMTPMDEHRSFPPPATMTFPDHAPLLTQWMEAHGVIPRPARGGAAADLEGVMYRVSSSAAAAAAAGGNGPYETIEAVRWFFNQLYENIRMDMHDRSQNRARQHRLLPISSRRWRDSATYDIPPALSDALPRLRDAFIAMHGDNLLDALLATFDLDLITPADSRATEDSGAAGEYRWMASSALRYEDYVVACREVKEMPTHDLRNEIHRSFDLARGHFEDVYAQISRKRPRGAQQQALIELHKAACKLLARRIEAYTRAGAVEETSPSDAGSRIRKWLPPVEDIRILLR